MWNDPRALARITQLTLAATVAFALWMVGRALAEAHLLFRQVEIHGAHHPETRAAVPGIVTSLQGGFFSLDLAAARREFELLPWVREARVRRLWPDRLVVELEEHTPAAAWNDLAILNTHGEVFPAPPWPGLPRVYAPEGSEAEVARRFAEFSATLGAHGWRIETLRVDARRAWQLGLSGGPAGVRAERELILELGRERLEERLQRFVTFYPMAAAQFSSIARVDMRYPNGFAVRLRGSAGRNT